MPTASVAIWASVVQMPPPISCVPLLTVNMPLASIDTLADAGERLTGYAALAMPQPMLWPCALRIEPGAGWRAAQPNFWPTRS